MNRDSKFEAPACAKPLWRRQAKSEIRNETSFRHFDFENSDLFRIGPKRTLRPIFGFGISLMKSRGGG